MSSTSNSGSHVLTWQLGEVRLPPINAVNSVAIINYLASRMFGVIQLSKINVRCWVMLRGGGAFWGLLVLFLYGAS